MEVPLPPPASPCSACSAFLNSRGGRARNTNKHCREKPTHKPPSGNAPLCHLSGRATKKPRILPPTETPRDQALGREKWAAVGRAAQVVASKSGMKKKKHLTSNGTLTMDEHVFDGKMASHLHEDLPLLLKDARPLEGAEKHTGKGTGCGAVCFSAPSFIAHEMEIARLNAKRHHQEAP